MSKKPLVHCEVAFALPHKQVLLALTVESGTVASQVITQSGVASEFPEFNFDQLDLGVFAEPITTDYIVQDGDRIEIYRPLTADPKEVRRQLAAEGKTMGEKALKK